MNHKLLDVIELAHILNVSQSTVYRMIRRGELKAIKVGPFLRVRREELERLLRESPYIAPKPKRTSSEQKR